MLKNLYKAVSLTLALSMVFLPVKGFAEPATNALPTSGVSGTATLTVSGNTLNVDQGVNDRAIIDYATFNVGSAATVQFIQPSTSAIALNRVSSDGGLSEIYGTLKSVLSSNYDAVGGRIFLINPNGILFGQGSSINTAGLVASTLSMATSDAGFLNSAVNTFTFNIPDDSTAKSVINSGALSAPGGFIALLGNSVENTNTGVISNVGNIVLAAGSEMTVSLDPYNLINIAVDVNDIAAETPENDAAGVINDGTLRAGNKVILTSRVLGTLFSNAINNSGIIEGKQIKFEANGDVEIQAGSQITATTSDSQDAVIDFNLMGDNASLEIDGSTLTAKANGTGDAEIEVYNDDKDFSLALDLSYFEEAIGVDLADEMGFSSGSINGSVSISDSTLLAQASGVTGTENTSDAEIGIEAEGPVEITNSHLTAQQASGDAFVGVMSNDSYIYVDEASSISAKSDDALAAVGLLAGGYYDGEDEEYYFTSIYVGGTIAANGGAGYGVVGIAGEDDLYLPGTISASGAKDAIPLAQKYLSEYYAKMYDNAYLEIYAPFSIGSGILMASRGGDIYLGNLSADAVVGIAGYGFLEYGEGYGSIYDLGNVNSRLLVLAAVNDIGCVEAPIMTNTDILAAYSFYRGDIVVDEANDIELGLVIPVTLNDSFNGSLDAILGMSVAANNGDIFIRSQGDMVINSVLAYNGGVFLQSEHGSMYAGKGWDPFYPTDLLSWVFEKNYLSDLYSEVGYAPIVLTYADPQFAGTPYNLVAGGYSYLSTPEGTIGVGTPESKDPSISGEIKGIVRRGVEAVTHKDPSPGIDLTRYTPPGLIYFYNERGELKVSISNGEGYYGDQIWPETIAEPVTSDNPLLVNVITCRTRGDYSALPDWFVNSLPIVGAGDGYEGHPDLSNVAGLTLEIGPKPQPNPIVDNFALLANPLVRDLRAYYEVMSPARFQSMVPASKTSFYAYHPLIETDMSAFDGITLDAGAYDFISDSIKSKKQISPYYGL
ncbi:MAG: filamentous hemagglutinin N-terminal domain-containing protein [Candidatus Omnitrophica bacterium]|nr:filamentous hemagglutinin N-terminal domain-containing protein [Candidatus Omnitrophota bacterium]